MKLNKEPVAILAAAGSIVAALTALGILSAAVGGGITAAIVAIGGMFVRSQVTPVSSVLPMLAEVGVKTAQGLDAIAAGAPGQVTQVATQTVAGVVATVSGKPTSLAEQITARVKAKVAGAGV